MSQFNYIKRFMIGIFIFLYALTVHSETKPKFSIIPSTPTQWLMPINGQTTIIYTVTNQTKIKRTLVMKSIPDITQQTSGPGVCSNPFTLDPGQSCQLVLPILGSQLTNPRITQGPEVCKTEGPGDNAPDPFLCSAACNGNQLNITRVGFEVVKLTVSPAVLPLIFSGPSGMLTVTNHSTTVTAMNVVSQFGASPPGGLPPGWGDVTLTTAGCTSISPGGSCTLTFTPGPTIHATVSFVFQGSNTNQTSSLVSVDKRHQTITFTSTAPNNATVGGATYTPIATASSGLPVSITVNASSSSVCSINAGVVSFIGSGFCILNANQAGNTNYFPAPQVQQLIVVGKGAQTITYTSSAPINATVGGATYIPTATATSGLPVTFTVNASSSSVCSISGGVVSFISVGTCTLNANQPGSANYNPAPQVQQSFTVGKGAQTITFTSTAPTHATISGTPYTPTATATSGLPVTITVNAGSTSICTISAGVVSFIAAGTCTLNANQAGDANYNPAPQVQQSFTVGERSQTITFTSTAPINATVGGATYTPTATATSDLPVTITVNSGSSSVCTISAGVVSFIGIGNCTLNANQAGDANYDPAPQVQQSFTVGIGSQTITFTSPAPSNATYGGPTYTPTATATSGLPVTITVNAGSSSVCSISGAGVVSFIGVGTCTLDANQAGNANYNPAPQVQQTFSVGKASQTIVFTPPLPPNPLCSGGIIEPYPVTAAASSGLTVTLSLDASSSACYFLTSPFRIYALGFQNGTCVVDANQAGDANYLAAPQNQLPIAVISHCLLPPQMPSSSTASNVMLSSSVNPSRPYELVTLTAKVSSTQGAPTGGTVDFRVDNATVCSHVQLAAGKATCAISSFSALTHPYAITARFHGSSGFKSSASATLNQYVTQTPTSTVPAAPIHVVAIPGHHQVTISWSPPTNTGGSMITGYTVTYGKTGTYEYTNPGCESNGKLSCSVDVDDDSGALYTFMVSATNAIGTGPVTYSRAVSTANTLLITPSILALSGLGDGVSRTINVTNTSANEITLSSEPIVAPDFPEGTTIESGKSACEKGKILAANGGSCTITIRPGAMASSNCTTKTKPEPSVITMKTTQAEIVVSAKVMVLGYGCIYQGGYVFSIDDSTPETRSIGGKVVQTTDRFFETFWSEDGISVWGIDDTSTMNHPSPTSNKAILKTGQLSCDAMNDGACATNNIIKQYQSGTAAHTCMGLINGHIDWYLPSVCELGFLDPSQDDFSIDSIPSLNQINTCAIDSTSILHQLADLDFKADLYWSSTQSSESSETLAWAVPPASIGNQLLTKKSLKHGTRCIRSLTI
jgi:hypothetical protein